MSHTIRTPRPRDTAFCWRVPLAALVALTLGASCMAAASGPSASPPQDNTDALTRWPTFCTLPLPDADKMPWVDFLLPVSVFDHARDDLGDLRLRDGRGHAVPYALRVLHADDDRQPLPARQFNRQTHPDHSVEVTLDLGRQTREHHEIEVATPGKDFRRRVVVEGSQQGSDWGTLVEHSWLVHYDVEGQVVDIHRVRYPASRLRYVRVRVYRDRSQSDDTPDISEVRVYRSVRLPGEYVTRQAALQPREAVRGVESPSSAWVIGLGARHVPCETLSLDVAEAEFARPYFVEILEGEGPRTVVARGELRRETSETRKPLEIRLEREVTAQRLRLVVADYSNPPLSLRAVRYTAAARQVVFARGEDLSGPVRVYFGNPVADPPRYDFAATLPPKLVPPPARASLGECTASPAFQPEPEPWTERWPWLVYVVLGTASLVLLAMLGLLARAALRRQPPEPSPAMENSG